MTEASPLAETTTVGALDMARTEDRRTLVKAISDGPATHRPRWGGITHDLKDQFVSALKVAMRLALEKGDHRAVNGCVETAARLDALNMADEQYHDKNSRLDSGKLTERVEAPIKFIKGVDESKL